MAKPVPAKKEAAPFKEVYTIIDKGEGKKAYWCRVGTCFTNSDGSFNVILDALPVNGKLNIRDKTEWEDDK